MGAGGGEAGHDNLALFSTPREALFTFRRSSAVSRNPSGGANVDSLPVVFFSKATLVFDATEAMSKVREGVGVWGVGGFDCC